MNANFARTMKVLMVLLLSVSCKSFASRYYVNVNNVSPGAGSSWATAFKDLNQALAIYTSGDEIWVAKGTYFPTATTNRAATFSITNNLTLLGGFNGTETAANMANPTVNPTILSGDIGVPGDPSDNSYHVVTYASPGTTGITMDGFTITGGNADQSYPAITTPSAGNTGGGFLELSIVHQFQSAFITHCNFTSNFAVYGGGFGAYGDGNSSSTFYSIVYCNFTNNSAFAGGGGASLGYNNNWSVSNFDMCVFTDNVSVSSQGSAIATMNTNGTSSNMLTEVMNCVMYNDPQPQLYNLATSATGNLQMYCSIVWNSVVPYTGPLYTGNNVLVDMCDLDLVVPLSSNLDVDPQFTNPAAGDFHTPHCSPLVDQGFTTASFNIGHTDPDGNPRLMGPKTDIGLYESQLPPYPGVTNAVYCQYATASPLTATALPGNTLLWYTGSSGGTGSTTAITPSTGTASAFPTYYYVSQVDALGCEGPRYPVKVTINAAAAAPSAVSPNYCQNVAATPLTATGSNLLWYITVGGTGSSTAPTPVTSSTGSTDYYVTQTPSGSCESAPTTVTVTIKPGAAAPVAASPNYCQNDAAAVLTATGSNLLWYTAATGGPGDPNAPTPSTASAGLTSYYVTQTPSAGGCESPRTEIDVTVHPTPSAEFTWSTPCEGKAATINAVSTAADQYTWDFGNEASVSGSGAGPYEVTWAASNTYPVTLKTTASGCHGQAQHLITVNSSPKVSIAALSVPLCAGNNVALEASGAISYQWSPATGLSDAGTANPIALLQSSIQYTVTGTDNNSCTGTAQITLDISADCIAYYLPDAFTPNRDGKNDEFRVRTADIPRSFTLIIFNRFGGKVFESGNIGSGWNGTIGGNAAPTGTYVYVMLATTSAGTIVKKQGTIMLIR